jgi:putative transposase
MSHKKAYKYRIYPTQDQIKKLNLTFGCVRFVWNKHVSAFYSYTSLGPNPVVTSKLLKDNPDYNWLNDVSAAVLQQKDRDFIEFKKQYFSKSRKSKLGPPKFKKKGQNDSYRLPNKKFKLNQSNSTIRLEKIGHVKIILDRVIPSDVKFISATISKVNGEFYASIIVDEDIKPLPLTNNHVGIDLGLIDLCTLSNGLVIHNPKWFRKNQTKLAKAQRKLSKKTKGSNRYLKQKLKVAKIHQYIARRRNWYLHQISTYLVRNYDTICMEDLNIAGMKKILGKSASDAGLATLVAQIKYKCDWYGKTFHQVSRFYPSSKTCSVCGEKSSFSMEVREWMCAYCWSFHDRDLNAAINILRQGIAELYKITPAELAGEGHGEDVSLEVGISPLIAASMKCQMPHTCVT